jgi:hypothetical protein
MREAIHWQEVSCGICGDVLLKHQAQFAPTGLVHDYRCWICAAKENSPNLQREERQILALEHAACCSTEDLIHPAVRALLPLVGVSLVKLLAALCGNL